MKFSLLLILSFALIVSGCSSTPSGTSVKIGEDGVSVKNSGFSVDIDDSGVSVDMSGSSVSISEKSEEITGEAYSQRGELVNIDETNCSLQYEALLKKYGNTYDGCFAHYPIVDSCVPSTTEKARVNIAIIFDTSGSMGAKIGSETMIDIAKEKLSEYIRSLDADISGGVILYGQAGNSTDAGKETSCKGIELLGELDTQKEKILSTISTLSPNGWTPIDASLKIAESYLQKKTKPQDKNIILLISDGKETCDGDPVSTAKKIAGTPGMYIDVIGFNVAGSAQEELINIAKNGNGKYSDVRSRADFENVFFANKNFLNTLQCGASKASLQLQAAVERKNTFYSCMYMLKEEEVKIITNASVACQDTVGNMLETRQREYAQKLQKIDDVSEALLDDFDKNIETVEDSFDK